jgi:hypothetical protein
LIGFRVLIYAILVAVVPDTAIQSANVFFVVAILNISILAGALRVRCYIRHDPNVIYSSRVFSIHANRRYRLL